MFIILTILTGGKPQNEIMAGRKNPTKYMNVYRIWQELYDTETFRIDFQLDTPQWTF